MWREGERAKTYTNCNQAKYFNSQSNLATFPSEKSIREEKALYKAYSIRPQGVQISEAVLRSDEKAQWYI